MRAAGDLFAELAQTMQNCHDVMSVLSLIVSTDVVRHELIFGLAGAAVSAIGIIYGIVALCGGLNSKYLSCSRASLQ